jgi:glycosyltransferase EpsE
MYRISVLMGIYNCAQTLQEALDSLYIQSYKDFKIILCDDGSNDDTLKIAEENARSHENVVVIRNEKNMGLNYTLNHCLKYADTEYIARMDGDDLSEPNRFQNEINFLDMHREYALVSCQMKYFDEDGIFYIGKGGGEPKIKDFIKAVPFCHAPCMARTEAFKNVGGYTEHKWLLREEDYHLWMKLYLAGYKGYNLTEALYLMRDDRNAAIRRNISDRWHEAYVKYLIWKNFHLPFYTIIHCLKPIILAYIPIWLYIYLHKRSR